MESTDIEHQVKRDFRHNFIYNMLDGSFFWFGFSFLTPSIILPMYIRHFTENPIILGLIPMISTLGFLIPQIFTVNWIERLPRKKFAVVNIGLFSERLPLILLPIATFFLANQSPLLNLIVFFILFFWHSFGAGSIAVGWQDMVAKIIPVERRGFFFGLTNFLGTASGVLGAGAAAWCLSLFAFPNGYALNFTTAAFFIMLSWFALAQTREPAVTHPKKSISQWQFFKTLPAILRNDKNFLRYILCQIVLALGGMANGFIIVYIAQRWQIPDSQSGNFTAAMLVGQAVANIFFGPLADRKGHKLVLEISYLLGFAALGLAILSPNPAWFYIVFAMRGINAAGSFLSGISIIFEFTSPEMRPTYIGLSNTISGIASGIAPLVGGLLAMWLNYPILFGISLGIGLLGLVLLRWSVNEPRKKGEVIFQETK
jgi:MFS family permease